jgi:hypothetical protein
MSARERLAFWFVSIFFSGSLMAAEPLTLHDYMA